MSKSYDHTLEKKWREIWQVKKLYRVSESDLKQIDFSLALPPPNVTGDLHLGHALNASLQDILLRYQRMKQKKVHYQIGFDHAGIGTQIVIQKQLAQENTSKEKLGKKAFQEKIWQWSEQNQRRIVKQLELLGISADFERSIFTLDQGYLQAVQKHFFELYKQNLIYRDKKLINWCPHCLTSLSDLEVVHQEQKASLYQIRYRLCQSEELALKNFSELIIATSRPETIFADVAVAINPRDTKYQELIDLIKAGKLLELEVPLTQRKIKLILNEKVEITFGTGALKITPAHDFNDYEIAQAAQLEKINILSEKAELTGSYVPEEFRNLERFEAREKVLAKLKEGGYLKAEEEYLQSIALHDRCGNVIEPFLSEQWFVKMKPLAQVALKALEGEKLKFYPKRYTQTYSNWLKNIKDWCISRQIWWGHKIPVFSRELSELEYSSQEHYKKMLAQLKRVYLKYGYRTKLKADVYFPSFLVAEKEDNSFIFQTKDKRSEIVFEKEDPAFQKELEELFAYKQEKDVLDTWFSSALWPFASQGWPESSFQPARSWTNLLVTAREIINLWVSRMVYSSLNLTKLPPFEDVLIHPVIQTPEGKRMSKSQGTGIDPIELVEKYGADACRIWYCSVGIFSVQDKRFPGKKEKDGTWSSPEIESYHKFLNKLWNIQNFILFYAKEFKEFESLDWKNLTLSSLFENSLKLEDQASLWILSKLNQLVKTSRENLENYRYGEFIEELRAFVWKLFCDWYLEICKLNLRKEEQLAKNTFQVLCFSFQELIKLLHPVIPFVTEELFTQMQNLQPENPDRSSKSIKEKEKEKEKSLSFEVYPEVQDLSEFKLAEESALEQIEQEISIIQLLRSIKQNILGLAANQNCELELSGFNLSFSELAKVSLVKQLKTEARIIEKRLTSKIIIRLVVPPSVDLNKRKSSIEKLVHEHSIKLAKLKKQVENPQFRDKVPSEVLQRAEKDLEEKLAELKQLGDSLKLLSSGVTI